MLPILGNQIFKHQLNRLPAIGQRSFAGAGEHGHKKEAKKLDPMVPKLNIPPEFVGIYDVKQEPGAVIINGRRYPYPYPGIHGEYNYFEILEKWRKDGKLDQDSRPIFYKMGLRERVFAKKLWYQRDPTKPVWKLGKYDAEWNMFLFTWFAFASLIGLYSFYRVIVPKELDVYEWTNWERWRKESSHH